MRKCRKNTQRLSIECVPDSILDGTVATTYLVERLVCQISSRLLYITLNGPVKCPRNFSFSCQATFIGQLKKDYVVREGCSTLEMIKLQNKISKILCINLILQHDDSLQLDK